MAPVCDNQDLVEQTIDHELRVKLLRSVGPLSDSTLEAIRRCGVTKITDLQYLREDSVSYLSDLNEVQQGKLIAVCQLMRKDQYVDLEHLSDTDVRRRLSISIPCRATDESISTHDYFNTTTSGMTLRTASTKKEDKTNKNEKKNLDVEEKENVHRNFNQKERKGNPKHGGRKCKCMNLLIYLIVLVWLPFRFYWVMKKRTKHQLDEPVDEVASSSVVEKTIGEVQNIMKKPVQEVKKSVETRTKPNFSFRVTTAKPAKSQSSTTSQKCSASGPVVDCCCPQECNSDILNTTVWRLLTCKRRVEFLIKKYHNDQREACVKTAEEYPEECGKCNPDKCSIPVE